MRDVSIFDKAVAAHAQWKGRLREAIETGQSEWKVTDVKADDRCDLGHWLNDLPLPEKTTDRYSHLKSLHTEFHLAASKVLALALSGKKEEALGEMARGSDFNKTSTELVLTLSQWRHAEAEQE